MSSSDLPSALLTPSQRDLLKGEPDISARGERAARSRIRDRLRASILDLQLIVSALPLDDIDDALTEPDEYEPEPGSAPPLANSLPALAAILYLATTQEGEEEDLLVFVDSAARGVETAVNRRGKTVEDHEVDWHLEVGDSLEEQARGDLSELPEHVLKQLLVAEEITSDQYTEAWTAKHADEE